MTSFETFVILVYVFKISNRIEGIYLLCILIGFLVFNVFVTYIIQQIAEAYRYKLELSMSIRQNELQLTHYKEINQKYQESLKASHDIKKHLTMLSALKSSDVKRAERYSSLI